MPDIGVKMQVQGESQFSKQMKDAARNVKSLDSELKLAQAEFKQTGDAQKLMADRGKVLHEQLEQQERAVEAAKKALEQLQSKGYDANSSKVMEWRGRLAQAQQQCLELNQAIENNAQGLNEVGQAYSDAASDVRELSQDVLTANADLETTTGAAGGLQEGLKQIGQNLGWNNLSNAINGINEKIEDGIRKVRDMGKAIWDAAINASVWADDLSSQATVYGIDTKTLQQWTYAAQIVDVSVSDIITARQRLLKASTSGSTDTAETFAVLGVNTRNLDGTLRDSMDVFWDVVRALGQVDDMTTRDAYAMQLLGKSANEMNPLIEAGREAWEEAANSAPVVSDKNIENLTKANDAYERMTAELNALKMDVLAQLAPVITDIATAISNAAQALREYLETPEGQEALTNLQQAISGLISDFTSLDFGKIMSDASTTITNIINSLSTFVNDKDKIIEGIKNIGLAIGGMKIAGVGLKLASLVANLKVLGLAGGNGATEAAGASTAGVVKGGLGTKVIHTLGGGMKVLGVEAAVIAAATAPAIIADNYDRAHIEERLEATREAATEAAVAIGQEGSEALALVNDAADALGVSEEKRDVFGRGVLGDPEAVEQVIRETELETAEYLSGQTAIRLRHAQDNGLTMYQQDELLEDMMAEAVDWLVHPQETAVYDIGDIISDSMDDILAVQEALEDNPGDVDAINGMYDLIDRLVDTKGVMGNLSDETKDLLGMYYDLESGYGAGSTSWYSDAQEVLSAIFGDLDSAWNQYLESGRNAGDGYTQGLEDSKSDATAAGASLGTDTVDALEAALDENSPSRKTYVSGENFVIGLGNGIYDRAQYAIDAANWLGQQIGDVFGFGPGVDLRAPGGNESGSRSAGGMDAGMVAGLIARALSGAEVTMDGKTVGRLLVPTIEDVIGEQLTSRRWM